MAENKQLSPKAKKFLIYGGIALVGVAAVYVATAQTEREDPIREPQSVSLTGNADTRSVSIEGLNRRLSELESGGARQSTETRNELRRMEQQVANVVKLMEQMQAQQPKDLDQQIQDAVSKQISGLATSSSPSVSTSGDPVESDEQVSRQSETSNTINQLSERLAAEEAARRREAERRREEREAERAEQRRRESIYVRPEPLPEQTSQANSSSISAPTISLLQSDEKEEEKPKESEPHSDIPDLHLPAGSILSAYLLTGLDAPTGTRAQSQPVPVLMRIKKEAILPNHAYADVIDCHLLGSAYGDLGSERVNIRGETVSCILADNSAIEGKVKFFVAGSDGKNGIRGTLVSRSGRVLASASGAALAQGLLSSLQDSSAESVFLGGGGGGGSASGGAIEGASKGFDLLTEYYLDLAEQTFPVIEIPNGRWVDVVLTEMLEVKFKG